MVALISTLTQIAVSLSIFIVWIFRFHNVEREFKEFKLSNITRNLVGVTKTSLSSALLLGIWYPEFIIPSAISLAIFMIFAQYFHYSVSNSWQKHLPSLVLFLLLILIIFSNYQTGLA